jgi:hypothetical protein
MFTGPQSPSSPPNSAESSSTSSAVSSPDSAAVNIPRLRDCYLVRWVQRIDHCLDVPRCRNAAFDGFDRGGDRPAPLVAEYETAGPTRKPFGPNSTLPKTTRSSSACAPVLITVLVDGLDAFLAGLAERGITTSPVTTIGGGARRTEVTDRTAIASR